MPPGKAASMDFRPIGIFDSGLGGLSAVRRLRALLPGEDLVYLGDTGRVPYGGRDRETLRRFAREDAAFLLRQGVKAILAACGTVSSVAMDALADAGVPVCGVVLPGAKAAAAATKTGRVGLIGTEAAVRAGAYERALKAIDPAIQVCAAACPKFVPLIEGGAEQDDPALLEAAGEYLAPIRDFGADTLILGCTHYPLIADAVRPFAGEGVTFIDAAAAAAEELCAALPASELRGNGGSGSLRCYVTGDAARFRALGSRFLPEGLTDVRTAKLETQE